jgi:hypothetical protein
MSTGVPREKALFCEALEIADPEQRRQFLDQACGADKALRERIEALLALCNRTSCSIEVILYSPAGSFVLPTVKSKGIFAFMPC